MRKVAILPVLAAALVAVIPYALDGNWWIILVCGLAGFSWLLQLRFESHFIRNISFLCLAGVGGVGIFLGFNPVLLLTLMVILLIALDIDRFTLILQPYLKDQTRRKEGIKLFKAHLVRLGIVAGLGWFLGVVALKVKISLNFISALLLGSIALLGLLHAVRNLREPVAGGNTE